MTEADRCRLCRAPGVRTFFERERYPLWGGPVLPAESAAHLRFAALRVGICLQCGFMSLTSPDPRQLSDLLYGGFYSSSNPACDDPENVSDWRILNLLHFIDAQVGNPGGHVLEIGSYDGQLLYQLRKRGFTVRGCEPNSIGQKAAAKHGFEVKQAYFGPGLYPAESFDLIVSRFVLEHVPEPLAFLAACRSALRPGGRVFLEVPDGADRVTNRVLGSFVPEHVSYFGQASLSFALRRSGFLDGHFQVYPGGIIVAANGGNLDVSPEHPPTDPGDLISRATSFEADVAKRIESFRSILKTLADQKKRIAIYGANSQTIECLHRSGLDEGLIRYVVDDDLLKEGLRLVGTSLQVHSFGQLVADPVDAVIVSAYLSQEKMAAAVRERTGPRTSVVRFYPSPSLIP